MGKQIKQPQDHQPKQSAVDQLRAEAKASSIDDLAGRSLTIKGRHGKVTVETLPDPLEWDADVMACLRDGDYLSAIIGMLSTEDGRRVRALRPSLASVMEVVMGNPLADDKGESEPSLGESQAS